MRNIAIPLLIAAFFAVQACSTGGAGSSGSNSGFELKPCPKDIKVACRRVEGKLYVAG